MFTIIDKLNDCYDQYQRLIPENIYHKKVAEILEKARLLRSTDAPKGDEEPPIPWIHIAQMANLNT